MTAPEIQQEIERTRDRLGDTVDELVARADVTARAQAKAADVTSRAQAKAADVTSRAQAKAAEVRARAQGKASDIKGKAAGMTGRVQGSPMVQRRWPLAAAAAAGVMVAAGSFLVWRRRKT
jgi:cell division septum initiation protein DivIVA